MGEEIKLNPFEKWKKRAKRFLCSGIVMFLLGLICFICGIALLVKFAEFWGSSTEKTKSGVSYFGAAVLILGVILLAVSIGVFVTLCIVYKRLENSMDRGLNQPVHIKSYPYGEAPYPQQKPFQPVNPLPQSMPTAPVDNMPEKQSSPADEGDVKIQVSEHNKF